MAGLRVACNIVGMNEELFCPCLCYQTRTNAEQDSSVVNGYKRSTGRWQSPQRQTTAMRADAAVLAFAELFSWHWSVNDLSSFQLRICAACN